MIISHIHIYGFGKWQDFQLTLPSNKVVMIYGENEAGKSTLRQFVLFLLFGLPPKKREFYRPKTGGQIGGRMTIWTRKQGEFIVERIHEKNNGEATCYLTDGNERGEEWLKEQLQRIDENIFLSVYSFSANDLNYLHKMKGEEIGEVLLGMGMTGTRALHQAEKKLEQKMEERFKPQGKNPPINQQINKLEILEKELFQLEAEEGEYQKKKRWERELVREMEKKKSQTEAEEQEMRSLEKKLQALPLILKINVLRESLPAYEEVHPFPENGLERFGKLKEAVLPLNSELSFFTESKQEYQSKLQEIKKKSTNGLGQEEEQTWIKEAEEFNRQSDYLILKEQELKEIKTKIENELDLLHLPLYFEELQELQMPFYTEDKWLEWRQQKQWMEQEITNLDTKIKESEITRETLQGEKESMSFPSNETTAEIATDKKYNENKYKYKTPMVSMLLFGMGIIISLGMLILSVLLEIDWLPVLSALLLAVFTGQWIWNYRSGFSRAVYQSPDARSSDLHRQREYINERIQKEKLQLLKTEEKKKTIEEQLAQLLEKIAEEKEVYPFLSGVMMEQWPKLYGAINQVLYKHKHFLSIKDTVRQIKIERETFADKAAFMLRENYKYPFQETLNNPVAIMKKEIKEKERIQIEEQQIEEKIADLQMSINACEQKLSPYKREMLNLLKVADVENEEIFYAKGKKRSQFEENQKQIDSIFSSLQTLLSEEEIEEMLAQKTHSQVELERKMDSIKEAIKGFRTETETLRQKLSDLRSFLSKMEKSEQLSEVRHRFEYEKTILMKQAKEWAKFKLAKDALEETKEGYRQKHFPEVMVKASEIFSTITGGKYVQIWLTEENKLLTQDKNGLRFEVQELSKGTHDQLYLALKLALSELTSKQHSFPFLIDDAFVHFDAERLSSLPSLLDKSASSNQIIWFTCNNSLSLLNDEAGIVRLSKVREEPVKVK